MMTNNQIVEEINRLPLSEKVYIVEIILRGIRKETRNNQNLGKGAKLLLEDYENDKELTVFTALDYEKFYEAN